MDRDKPSPGLRLVQANTGTIKAPETTAAPSVEGRKNLIAGQVAQWPARVAVLLPLDEGHDAFRAVRHNTVWQDILAGTGAVQYTNRATPDIIEYFFTVTAVSHEGAKQRAREVGLQLAEHFSGRLIKSIVDFEPTPLPPTLQLIESGSNE